MNFYRDRQHGALEMRKFCYDLCLCLIQQRSESVRKWCGRKCSTTLFGPNRKSLSLNSTILQVFNSRCYQMNSLNDICQSFENILHIYENDNKNVDEKFTLFTKYLENRKFHPIRDFSRKLDWFNVSNPLTLSEDLKGKVVLLDFFTYCCINCMHILPFLSNIESKFEVENGFVVIGVHCAKFDNEKQSNNIQSAIERYGIKHAVINDSQFEIWKSCNIHCWPSLLLLDPDHRPICLFQGEGNYDLLEFCVKSSLTYYESAKKISNHSIAVRLNSKVLHTNQTKDGLAFPGKIACFFDTEYGFETVAISDTGHHRILITDDNGNVKCIIGNGNAGFKDGSFMECEFNNPYGVVFQDAKTIYVADTENHAIRRINMETEMVTTIAGDGAQSFDRIGGKSGPKQGLSSPWDIAVFNNEVLLIAMAGTHQIWAYFLTKKLWWKSELFQKNVCVNIAGSGREENRNNCYPKSAGFAQPSGICLDENSLDLYIADSESSTIRKLSLLDGKVSGVVGGDSNPQDLFAFGDADGKLHAARLQHPLGVTILSKKCKKKYVFVADSYNHKIKYIKVGFNEIGTLQFSNSNHRVLNEPHGLCASHKSLNKLYVCDTNNHCIKIIHLISVKNDAEIQGTIGDFNINFQSRSTNQCTLLRKSIEFCKKNGFLELNLNFELGNHLKLNSNAAQILKISYPDQQFEIVSFDPNLKLTDNTIRLKITNDSEFVQTDSSFVHLHCALNLCNDEVCLTSNVLFVLHIKFSLDDDNCNQCKDEIFIHVDRDSVKLQ